MMHNLVIVDRHWHRLNRLERYLDAWSDPSTSDRARVRKYALMLDDMLEDDRGNDQMSQMAANRYYDLHQRVLTEIFHLDPVA